MSYYEECMAALDEDIAALTEILRGVYAGGERLKEEERCTERQR